MKTTLYIVGGLLAVIVTLNLIGRSLEQNIADQRDYQTIKTATDEITKFPWPKQ